MSRRNHHVLIVGAGPVGLAAALFLHERGVEVEILDGAWTPRVDDFSVVLHPDVLARLDDIGIDLDLTSEALPIDRIAAYERGRRRAAADLAAPPPAFGFAAVVPLWRLRDKLEQKLRERHVKVQWHHRLGRIDAEGDHVTAIIEVLDREPTGYAIAEMNGMVGRTTKYEPPFVIGADGHDSVVRGQLRVPWRTFGDEHVVAAFEVDDGADLGNEMRIYAGDVPIAMWPVPGGGTRITFQLPPSGDRLAGRLASGEAPDDADLSVLLAAHGAGIDEPLGRVRWSHVTRCQPGLAERPAPRTVWLLGEAAHELPALASPALNHGISTAHDLASLVGRVLHDHAPDEILERLAAASANALSKAVSLPARYAPRTGADPARAAELATILPFIPAAGADLDHVARQLGLAPAGAPLPIQAAAAEPAVQRRI